ncbi:50S ribosomal protein L24 [Pedobacter chitinilyticus]|jgi:large subunit ribosomal protein L24|uniref:Large ribosomal subunit protein uL24 n=1 Tax=Pedobacter chitinilyticus TaxID=2233776 RepID=A0A3S3PLZ2_9SPHI|nr:50S ribosomal protein L24 [Pedobacter chitinilyticus]RWU03665.1 50S ribosomal protein L24 [Pedobacter chitinilyticus]|eukprot:Mycagemm_TRINITY_DN10133_c0_g2::TRINITY_DN10133_c0_g2_i1::g.5216::m.5216 type:complete len:114 gc:universal TRINITY_DN10133_c0_g2_i1:596-937(+)
MGNKVNKPAKLKIRKGDLVKVIAGDSKGQQGKVQEVLVSQNRVVVEGVNLVSKHTKPSAASPNGGIIKKEAALHISNVQLVDPKSGKTTRVGRKLNADGKLVRVAKISGEEIK